MEENKWICVLSTFSDLYITELDSSVYGYAYIPHGNTINEIVYHEQFRE